ncbi:MAG: Penicillin-binding protein [Candidatus Gottesmanbacteria bacterium GW2011_GWB1_43_11]|uniref:Penicillin-binding protein n=1 Tax=Candidatus Gottesmanbacteria bacterium GW2011_GWB1_43_11 TaxID=1618446 RepID=A0A0G1CPL5_9BACT|nr:MAG: Penicillin-binding protein [Candidatus Gottesmanbacteria bacterium GW2011_GWA2_42_16]KKS55602.1 MAG: Penicillin-binding protein [Candidatus Gottesmanbacteria bacterium GW2011_GWA1_42_26]KKS87645.1 MAG: Penicillin-binding protein [Candidatus Gottesmanbacteria bacterium GW2011_GWB1_43_11]OGG08844.1 MAG: hypothetical protein A2699_05985 [Candidatus Gottesmanbacteria bacterium RIFCSPHIGHO2_01_FULL_43_15]HCM37183.1 penicillin-binding protein [Patescibacteria group bacterium]
MPPRKQTDTTTKKTEPEFIFALWSAVIFFLARIGDITIIITKGILFVLKLAFSIIKNLAEAIGTVIEDWLKQSTTALVKSRSLLQFSFIQLRLIFFRTINFLSLLPQRLANQIPQVTKIHLPHPPILKSKLTKIKTKTVYRRHRFAPPPLILGMVIGALVTLIFVFIPYNFYLYIKLLPNPRLLSQRVIPVTTQIFDRSGNLLYEIHGDEDRKPVPLVQIPKFVKQATIAIEDRNFYFHPGFSLTSIARAARETFINHNTQGGSTITQQLIKNALLTPEVSFQRKLKELILAFWAERIYSKDQILEMYLNQVPYGGIAWGIEAAAETYFGKKVADLTLAEAAYLAGLPAAPTLYSPYGTRPELAQVRQREVLARMVDEDYITQTDATAALSAPIQFRPQVTNIKAPHFVMYVRDLITKQFGSRIVDQGGLRITTTLDLPTQEKVQEIVTNNVNDLAKLRVGNGAAIVTDPKTGDILAMVGSKDYFSSQDGNVNVVLSERQPGSSIKVVNYAAGLQNGLTAASVIDDAPISFPNPGQAAYTPVNYDSKFHGLVTIRSALANSYNIPAVKVLNRIGVPTMITAGRAMGISTWEDDSRFGLALTLGGGEVTLLDMAKVYGVLANSGKRTELESILKITDYTGRVYYEKDNPKTTQTLPAEIAFILSSILSDNRARTPAFGPNSALVIPGKTVAVKTGTTNDKRDNWTLGYTPSLVVGVWVGNNDNSPMDQYLTSGVTGAAPIWNQIMQGLLQDKADQPFTQPPNVVSLPCFGITEYFVRGTEPKGGCGTFPSPRPSLSP